MIKINAQPVFKRGRIAVWRGSDIPIGCMRFAQSDLAEIAAQHARAPCTPCIPNSGSCRAPDAVYAAVLWADLQPADPAIVRQVIVKEMSGLRHGPNGTGKSGPCDLGCVKCACERDLMALSSPHPVCNAPPTWLPLDMSRESVLTRLGHGGEGLDRSTTMPQEREIWAAALRAKVAASAAAEHERERNRVLVDLEVEPWE